jgi:type VI secretion system secreted protein VgrG
MAEITAVETFLLFDVQGVAKDTFKVVSVAGTEAISSLFRFEFELASPDHDLDYQSVLGKKGHLTIKGIDADRHLHGLVSRIEQVGRNEDLSRYRLTLVPALWVLGLRQTSRIFQEKSIPDIIKKVLQDAGIPSSEVELSVHGDHQPWEYCVQYRETDLAFISRLMEQEGIFYFFKHSSSGAVLRIGDDPSDHPAAPDVAKLPYRSGAGMAASEETVSRYSLAEEVRPDAFAVKDYNFMTPAVDLSGSAKDKPGLKTEVFDFPGEYDAASEGTTLAKIRLQELRASRRQGTGESNCARLTPGHTFEIGGHPRKDHNGKYLVVNVQHHGSQPQALGREGAGAPSSYSSSFTCIPADVPYRPPRVTPRPMAQGAQTAVVVGPAGEEIHTDEHGRIKVQFHWDREGKKDENSSCWIRVAQPWAGSKWGSLFIPRIGWEVVVEFMDGDPDQPLVTGSVYHADNPPPYSLPGEKTKSTIKSNSSKGGDGSNELRFEDAKGSEEIYIHGQKDLNIVIENDETDAIKANRKVSIDKDETLTIGGSRTESVSKDEKISIGGGRTESVTKDESITVSGNRSLSVSKDQSVTVTSNHEMEVGKRLTLKVGDDAESNFGKNLKEQISKKYNLNVGDALTINVDNEIILKTGSSMIKMKSDGSIQIEGSKLSLKASGDVSIKGSKVSTN